ncbi:hypothetical protein QL285_050662 [Trifolium repens]|nr:hypothetical protein QL285_050662 [Trifolium repens]
MGKRRKISGQELLERLQGQGNQNDRQNFQDPPQPNVNNQMHDQMANVDITNNSIENATFDSSSFPNETVSQQKEEPLLIKVRDTSTGEITIQRMVVKQVWHLGKTKKVMVEIGGNGQGIDNGSNLLVRFLGDLAQKSAFCPVSIERWDSMPVENGLTQWKCIEDHFEFDYVAGVKWAWSTLGERWKAYKYKLRCQHFYPNKSKEEILANRPSFVPPTEWVTFVNHYKNDQMKKVSEQNTRNRQQLKVSHAGGTKSNARRGRQMELQLNRPICRGEVLLSTLIKKNGNYVNDKGKAIADKISENLLQDQERAATLGVPSKINAYPDDAVGKVYGAEHSGRVRVLGVSVCPSNVFGTRNHFSKYVNVGSTSQNVEDLKKQVHTLEEKLSGYEETKEQLTQTQNQLAYLTSFLQGKFGDELPLFNQGSST